MNENIITEIPLTPEIIREKIYIIRGKKVMIDRDLAILYEILTKQLNQSVRRNVDRFPEDFMFQLTKKRWIIGYAKLAYPMVIVRPKIGSHNL